MNRYYYNAFGLTITSDIEFNELPAFSARAHDAAIRYAEIPDVSLSDVAACRVVQGVTFKANHDRLILDVDAVARFLVRDGNEIIVQPYPAADPDLVRLFLFGSAFGALLFQRGVLPLHGCSIVTPRGAVLCVGHSGYGKSTLAGVFHQRGYAVLSDDVSAVTSVDGIPHILASYPRILLWEDSMAHIGMDNTGLKLAHARENKYQVPVSSTFASEPTSLHAIYIINPGDDTAITITPLDGFAKIHSLTEHTYRGQFLEGMKLTTQHFTQINAVARHACICRVDRPKDASRIEELADRIEDDFLLEVAS
jgi:hypothetical protein